MKLTSIAAVAVSAFLLAVEWGKETAASMTYGDYRVVVSVFAPLLLTVSGVLFVQAFRHRKRRGRS